MILLVMEELTLQRFKKISVTKSAKLLTEIFTYVLLVNKHIKKTLRKKKWTHWELNPAPPASRHAP
jgi:hypothetical protein